MTRNKDGNRDRIEKVILAGRPVMDIAAVVAFAPPTTVSRALSTATCKLRNPIITINSTPFMHSSSTSKYPSLVLLCFVSHSALSAHT